MKGNCVMKKFFNLALVLVLVLSMSIPAFAAEVPEVDNTVVVKTWQNEAGETVTGIISKDPVLAVRTTPENGNEARGFISGEPDSVGAVAYGDDVGVEPLSDVSDSFYFRIYNDKDVVVSTYKVTITGKITALSRKITAVTFTRVSGNTCTTSYEIDGNEAYVVVTHNTYGYLDGTFTLEWDGTFTVS